MKKWVEYVLIGLFYSVILAVCVRLTFGFYYLIFVLAKRVFFGE